MAAASREFLLVSASSRSIKDVRVKGSIHGRRIFEPVGLQVCLLLSSKERSVLLTGLPAIELLLPCSSALCSTWLSGLDPKTNHGPATCACSKLMYGMCAFGCMCHHEMAQILQKALC